MVKKTNSSSVLKFEVGGGAQVGHVGLWMLGRFADRRWWWGWLV